MRGAWRWNTAVKVNSWYKLLAPASDECLYLKNPKLHSHHNHALRMSAFAVQHWGPGNHIGWRFEAFDLIQNGNGPAWQSLPTEESIWRARDSHFCTWWLMLSSPHPSLRTEVSQLLTHKPILLLPSNQPTVSSLSTMPRCNLNASNQYRTLLRVFHTMIESAVSMLVIMCSHTCTSFQHIAAAAGLYRTPFTVLYSAWATELHLRWVGIQALCCLPLACKCQPTCLGRRHQWQ